MTKKVLDLNGFTLSGKAAFTDLFRELKGYYVPDTEFEFCLFRIQDGLMDLKHALVDDWSPVRSDSAIRRFKKLNSILSSKTPKYTLLWASSPSGYNYNQLVHPEFYDITEKYINSFVTSSYKSMWPFALHDVHSIECFWRRVGSRLGFKNCDYFDRYVTAKDGFMEKTQSYVEELISYNLEDEQHTCIIHNGLEPFRAHDVNLFCKNGKSIVIHRDPRDVYIAGLGVGFSASANVNTFIAQYKMMREVYLSRGHHEHVLEIGFEDLVLDYENTLQCVFNFLGENSDIHLNKKSYFDPSKSRKGVGMWKSHSNPLAINTISEKLPQFCRNMD